MCEWCWLLHCVAVLELHNDKRNVTLAYNFYSKCLSRRIQQACLSLNCKLLSLLFEVPKIPAAQYPTEKIFNFPGSFYETANFINYKTLTEDLKLNMPARV